MTTDKGIGRTAPKSAPGWRHTLFDTNGVSLMQPEPPFRSRYPFLIGIVIAAVLVGLAIGTVHLIRWLS